MPKQVPIEELREGDVLRVFHFVGARRKKHYMYRLITIDEAGTVVAVDISEIATKGFRNAFRHRVSTLKHSEYEVLDRVEPEGE